MGDSITEWLNRSGTPVTTTWPNFMDDPTLSRKRGFAYGGAKLEEMLSNIYPYGAHVLVVAAGTNDLGDVWGTPQATMLAQLDAIVARAECAKTLICHVPPFDAHPTWASTWNNALTTRAALRGWALIDPWVNSRTGSQTWVSGRTTDGIHPTSEASALAAAQIEAAINALRD